MTERDQYWELARATAIEREHTRARQHAAKNAQAWREAHADAADTDVLRERRLADQRQRVQKAVPLLWTCSAPLNGGRRCTYMLATKYMGRAEARRHLGEHAHVTPEMADKIVMELYP